MIGGRNRHHRHHSQSKGESKIIPLKYINRHFSSHIKLILFICRVTLETLYNGETKSVPFTRKIVCNQCHGYEKISISFIETIMFCIDPVVKKEKNESIVVLVMVKVNLYMIIVSKNLG